MKNETDYKAALAYWDSVGQYVTHQDHSAAIKRSLLIAEKVMAEPSDAEVGAGIDYALSVKVHGGHPWPSYIAKLRNAMRAKLIEEIDHAEG